jgi:hypothetical protein
MKNLGGKYPLKASFFRKNKKEETGRNATIKTSRKRENVFKESRFEIP